MNKLGIKSIYGRNWTGSSPQRQRVMVAKLSNEKGRAYKGNLLGFSSRDVWLHVNEVLGGNPEMRDTPDRTTVSRASIINGLNGLVEHGAVKYGEVTGKGGHRRIYSWASDKTPEEWCYDLFKERLATLQLNGAE